IADPLIVSRVTGWPSEVDDVILSVIFSVATVVPFGLAAGLLGGLLTRWVFGLSVGVGQWVARLLPWVWVGAILAYLQIVIFAGPNSYGRFAASALVAAVVGGLTFLLLRGVVHRLRAGRPDGPTIGAIIVAVLLCVPLMIWAIRAITSAGAE
ncbi:MAG: hypothetical protein ACYTFO_05275, partial [Planctomycetota bacterium]